MARSSNSSTWMLPLLLLSLFISFHQSSSESNKQTTTMTATTTTRSCRMHEFITNVKKLGKVVQNCSLNCSLVPVTDKMCQCFNLSMSEGDLAFPRYFTKGLRSFHNTSDTVRPTRDLIRKLERGLKGCETGSLEIKYETVLSPKSFWKKLEHMAQQINSIRAVTSNSNQ